MKRNLSRNLKWLSKPICIFCLLAVASTGWAQSEVLKLLASDAAVRDQFGYSVSINVKNAVVGAPFHDDNGSNSGSAYIFQQDPMDPDSWDEIMELTIMFPAIDDEFGYSVSINGDYAIVGARWNDHSSLSNPGAAYIFYRHQGGTDNWGQVTKITASDAATNDNFGHSVSISGDLAVIGLSSGAAYIFERDGAGDWNEVKILTATGSFGRSVSINGDTAIVGALADNENGFASGAAYIFQQDFGGKDNWGQVEKLTASDGAQLHFFGQSVSISIDTAVVGAYGNNGFAGSAYIFERDAGGTDQWNQTAILTASDATGSDQFGFSVSIRGEGVIVGADNDDDDGFESGSAYLFREPLTGWASANENAKITASDATAGDEFGFFVSFSGDHVIVGAHFNDDNGSNSGSVYIFDGVCPCPWDLDSDEVVSTLDILELFAQWGTNGPADFDGSGAVGTSDLLILFANWGVCPCAEGTEPLSFEAELADACISEEDWDDYENIMQTGTQAEKDNYNCWMRHWIEDCNRCSCVGMSGCPGEDPFD